MRSSLGAEWDSALFILLFVFFVLFSPTRFLPPLVLVSAKDRLRCPIVRTVFFKTVVRLASTYLVWRFTFWGNLRLEIVVLVIPVMYSVMLSFNSWTNIVLTRIKFGDPSLALRIIFSFLSISWFPFLLCQRYSRLMVVVKLSLLQLPFNCARGGSFSSKLKLFWLATGKRRT